MHTYAINVRNYVRIVCVCVRLGIARSQIFLFVANLYAMRHFGTGQSLHDASGQVTLLRCDDGYDLGRL